MERDFKGQGNKAFALGDYQKALNLYNLAIESAERSDTELLVKCYNNVAMCCIKLNQFENSLDASNKALDVNPNDMKALFRKAQSLKELSRIAESYEVLNNLLQNNANAQTTDSVRSLFDQVKSSLHQEVDQRCSTASKIEVCLEKLNDPSSRQQALSNLAILTKDSPACVLLVKHESALATMKECICSSTQGFDQSCMILTNIAKCPKFISQHILTCFKVGEICRCLAQCQSLQAAGFIFRLVDSLTLSFTDLEAKRRDQKKPINVSFTFADDEMAYIDELFRTAGELIGEPSCTGPGRDRLLNILLKYIDQETSCAWSARFIGYGIPKVLRIGASTEAVPDKCLPLTPDTRLHASCLLSAVYDDLCSDIHREEYRQTCETFMRQLIQSGETSQCVRAISCLVIILQGPFDVGNSIIGSLGLINVILQLATSKVNSQEQLALDAILLSSSKTDKALGLLNQGHLILKELYLSEDENTKIRALLECFSPAILPMSRRLLSVCRFLMHFLTTQGLCKLSSSKGSDFSQKTVTPKSIEKLESTCLSFLVNTSDKDVRRHAADGLAFLSLDGEVKERLIENKQAMQVLLGLVEKDPFPNTCLTVCSVLFNLTNAETHKKPDPEMVKLAQYSKHHIPEDHPKDGKEFYEARRTALMELNVSSTLVQLSKQKSESCRILLAKICLALTEEPKHRGTLVAAGLGKVLIPLSIAHVQAAQALARLSISCNPETAFPGQRCLEVIRPMIQLLHPDRSGLENFEALLALTNLATVSASVRKKIIDDAFSAIEQYMFEEHEMLRRAATEVVCNLCVDEQVYSKFTADNDRVRLLVLFCNEDDLLLNRAAAGALAQLSILPDVCRKIVMTKNFVEILKSVTTTSDMDLQYRGFVILHNLVANGKETASYVVESDLMDVAFAMSRLDDTDRKKIVDAASTVVRICLECGYVKPLKSAFE